MSKELINVSLRQPLSTFLKVSNEAWSRNSAIYIWHTIDQVLFNNRVESTNSVLQAYPSFSILRYVLPIGRHFTVQSFFFPLPKKTKFWSRRSHLSRLRSSRDEILWIFGSPATSRLFCHSASKLKYIDTYLHTYVRVGLNVASYKRVLQLNKIIICSSFF